jgi:hypothetical protein
LLAALCEKLEKVRLSLSGFVASYRMQLSFSICFSQAVQLSDGLLIVALRPDGETFTLTEIFTPTRSR